MARRERPMDPLTILDANAGSMLAFPEGRPVRAEVGGNANNVSLCPIMIFKLPLDVWSVVMPTDHPTLNQLNMNTD